MVAQVERAIRRCFGGEASGRSRSLCCLGVVASAVANLICLVGCNSDRVEARAWDLGTGASAAPDTSAVPDAAPQRERACGGSLPNRTQLTKGEGGGFNGHLALGPEECPHVNYYDSEAGALAYAVWTGNEWERESLEGLEGRYPHDLAVGPQGRPSIVFEHADESRLVFARREASGRWEQETVARTDIDDLLYDVDPVGRPLVVAQDATEGANGREFPIRAYSRRDGTWQMREVFRGAGHVYLNPPIAFDRSGAAHVAFSREFEAERTTVFAASSPRGGSGDWTIELERQRSVGSYQSVVTVVGDQPHLLSCRRHDAEPRTVDHIFRRGGEWVSEPIEECTEGTCWCGGIDVDGRGRLHVLYGRVAESQKIRLRHGVQSGGDWRLQDLGQFDRSDLALLVDDQAGVVHVTASENRTKYVRDVIYFNFPTDGAFEPEENQ